MNRRTFLSQSGVIVGGLLLSASVFARGRKLSANDKLNIGIVGVAHQGRYNLNNVASENIVALCDVNEEYLTATKRDFPKADTYSDFRRMLERRDLDAVVVATPDHTHAVAAVAAMKRGCHVYCEKPLTRTISECRAVMETARKEKCVTQIGTQIHAGDNYRRVVELVQTGAIGPVAEVHVWSAASYGGKDRPKHTPPIPAGLNYDLWLGPVPELPYSPEYVPGSWRNWWAFGGGALGDFGCHFMDLPHWALGLREPLSAVTVDGPPVHPDSTPPWLIVRYEYPARETQSPVTLTWYHGGKQPSQDVLSPALATEWKSGVLFVGSKGQLLSDYSRHLLLPEDRFKDFVRPQPFIPKSIGHHAEWITACKTGGSTTCNFDYSGALTTAVLLGNVAYRAGSKIEWNSKKLLAANCPDASQFIQHKYRKGWKL